MNLASYSLAWDSKSQRLLLPVWRRDTQYPNTVIAVNPVTGTVTQVAQVQPDPTVASPTDDGSYFYTAFANVERNHASFAPQSGRPDNMDAAKRSPIWVFLGQRRATEPGAPHTFAATFSDSTTLSTAGNLAIYDDGVARPDTAVTPLNEHLEWGAGNTQLYSFDNPGDVNAFNVTASGATSAQFESISGTLANGGTWVHFDPATGYLYTDGGIVYDPATQTTIGNFNASDSSRWTTP